MVELDSEMVCVAEKWFDFTQGERMRVHVADGVEFVKKCLTAGKKGMRNINIRCALMWLVCQ